MLSFIVASLWHFLNCHIKQVITRTIDFLFPFITTLGYFSSFWPPKSIHNKNLYDKNSKSVDSVQRVGPGWELCGVVYCTILYWSVFVEIIKEPYISPAAPKGLLLPADLHTGRRVMKQASLEIHHCGEPRQFSLSFPPTPLFFCLLKFFFLPLSQSFGLLNVLQCFWFKHVRASQGFVPTI